MEELSRDFGRAAKQPLTLIKCFNTYRTLPYIISFEAGTIFILQMGKLELREVK